MYINRRTFTAQLSSLMPALLLDWKSPASSFPITSLSFGLIADPHKDLMPDADLRLETFMKQVEEKKPDFILQLGDFCFPKNENKGFLNIWNTFSGPSYHVLGNHDMDVSSKRQTMDYWGMEMPFYSFDKGGFHFIVLDANFMCKDGKYIDYDKANFYVDDQFRTFVHPDQLEWLKADLDSTQYPSLIFSHQSLFNYKWGIKNRLEIQKIMEAANLKAGWNKVVACFNGHDHIDFCHQLNGIHYIEINSMSYQWLGSAYENKSRYPKAFYDQYPNLGKQAPYKEPLFCFVTISSQGELSIEGTHTSWMAPSPADLGKYPNPLGSRYSTLISDRKLQFTHRP